MDKTNKNWKAMSDTAILKILGKFIRHHRLEQNKSQSKLAEEAGINRSTLSEFEQGRRSNTITLIQILRALNRLQVLEPFQVQTQLSPILLAKLEKNRRKRASKIKKLGKRLKSDW